ncbi:dipicolinate synthase subunit A [Paenibacillus swuensis]|uniref:Dipicolinate synthase subunit A n=1 Tax=Paenibacillus swuensis TaxID=1178515 RepID=A0A172TKT6_9BACL|nr:dipicolinate synthase subunit DpsA [Paenibacillus swuensis]ANE47586.1 dipicolinate synthase subunit A [Paenibacillus swuensis]
MLTGIHVVCVGGDARMLEVIKQLSEMDAIVTLIGFDNLQSQFSGVGRANWTEDALKGAHAVILPVVGTDDAGKISAVFSTEELFWTDEHAKQVPEGAAVYTGMAKPFLKNSCLKHQIRLVEILERDDVAIYNSIPTAEGAVMMAIQHTDIMIHGSNCIVLGLGRTGFTLARTLQGLRAKVKVGVRREADYARATEMGFQPFYTRNLLDHVTDVDLLFNTIPTMIITAQIIAKLPYNAVIIDLASAPGGTDFRFAERRGVKALLAPGLPGIVAPKSAGRILANCLSQLILEDSHQRGNV